LRARVDPGTVTKLIHGMRPTVACLRGLVRCWDSDADAIAVLCAHLRDEIARAQVSESLISVAPAATGSDEEHPTLTDAFYEIRRYAATDDSVRQLILDLAVVLRAADHAAARGHAIAADSTTEYRSKKR
jgi:hypothetical protein